jgi:hypothetical protein
MNEAQARIPIFRTVASAYGRGIGALLGDGALFRYFVYASLLGIAAFAARVSLIWFLPWHRVALPAGAAEIISAVVPLVVFTALMRGIAPFAVAVHRKILLGEAPRDSYLMAMRGRRERRFFLASFVVLPTIVLAILTVPMAMYLIYGVNPLSIGYLTRALAARPALGREIGAAEVLAHAIVGLAAVRSAFAFPAIAIDRPDASLRQSFAETRGTTGRLFAVFLLMYVPPVTIYAVANHIIIAMVVRETRGGGSIVAAYLAPPFIAVYAALVVLMISMVAVTAAAAARCYEIRVGPGAQRVADVFS